MKYLVSSLALFAPLVAGQTAHLEVDVSESGELSTETLLSPASIALPVTDTTELLKQSPGVSLSRKGGKGFEPIIRGQQQSQLNVLVGDAFIQGACPGRMDTPAGYATPVGYDRIRVIRGYESVIYGSGGAGGTVLFERDDPEFHGKSYQGNISARYAGNAVNKVLSADVAAGSAQHYLRTYGAYQDSGNYKDGNGDAVSSAFQSNSGGVLLAGELTPSTKVSLNFESTHDNDVHYSGNGMDAPWSQADTWRLKAIHDHRLAFFDTFELSVWHADVQHLMDNYSVRVRKPSSPWGMKAPSSAKTWGGRVLGTAYLEKAELNLGLSYQASDKDARRYRVNRVQSDSVFQSHMWPGVEYRQLGIFSELDYDWTEKDTLRLGMRLDDLQAEATRAMDSSLGTNSPNALYQRYYGIGAEDAHEQNVSGLLGWQHALTQQDALEFRLSRTVRTADATERYMASRGSCCHGSDDWVGNPAIKPEQHYQLDAAYLSRVGKGEWSALVYLDEVEDYIHKNQSESGAFVYNNIKARLYGFEVDGRYAFGRFKPSASIAWTRGDNRTDGNNLPQIPPLTLAINLDYEEANRWLLQTRWELAARQDKVDTASGQDAGESVGYGVMHLYGWYQLNAQLKLQGGVQNLFDKAYAPHLNRASKDPFNPEAERVLEPGRELWVGVNLTF